VFRLLSKHKADVKAQSRIFFLLSSLSPRLKINTSQGVNQCMQQHHAASPHPSLCRDILFPHLPTLTWYRHTCLCRVSHTLPTPLLHRSCLSRILCFQKRLWCSSAQVTLPAWDVHALRRSPSGNTDCTLQAKVYSETLQSHPSWSIFCNSRGAA